MGIMDREYWKEKRMNEREKATKRGVEEYIIYVSQKMHAL